MIARSARLVACMLACACLAGCVIPIPTPPGDMASSRLNIGDAVPAFIAVGRTTRDDVLLDLGEPDFVSQHEQIYTYVRVSSEGGVMLVGGAGMGAGGAIGSESMLYRFLTITFDKRGMVASARSEQARCRQAQPDQDSGTHDFGPCAYPPGQARVLARFGRVFVPSRWVPGTAGYAWRQALRLVPPAPHGALVIGESRIEFFAQNADDESTPLAGTAYSDIVGISLDSTVAGQRVVMELRDGSKESFSVLQGDRVDAPATIAAFDLAKARWQEAGARGR